VEVAISRFFFYMRDVVLGMANVKKLFGVWQMLKN
jgi:hypothetical protein